MNRRKIISLIGSAALASPIALHAQQPESVRRVGVLMGLAQTDTEGQARFNSFRRGLEQLGWKEGQNIELDVYWAADADARRAAAEKLASLKPDVILGAANPATVALHKATQAIPIVFAQVADPVSEGFVASLAHPGGNLTGFLSIEDTVSGKWLELLKQVVPSAAQVLVLYDPSNPSWQNYWRAVERGAASSSVQLTKAGIQETAEIDANIKPLAHQANNAILVFPAPSTTMLRKEIVASAARYGVLAVYPYRFFVTDGGLMSYGVDNLDLYLRAASYVDRVLKGEHPAELPVQEPTKFQFVVNLKVAKALGLSFPSSVLATADEVIE